MRHHRMRLALVAAVLMLAPAAHAQTMNSLSSPGSSTPNYVAPRYGLEELNKPKISETQSDTGLKFYVGPSNSSTWGGSRFNSQPGGVVGTPPDQSKFNDR
jgi:hypothetical protein